MPATPAGTVVHLCGGGPPDRTLGGTGGAPAEVATVQHFGAETLKNAKQSTLKNAKQSMQNASGSPGSLEQVAADDDTDVGRCLHGRRQMITRT